MRAPKNKGIYSLFGYAVICNDCIHEQQILYLENLLKDDKETENLEIIYNIILQQKDINILSFVQAVNLLNLEDKEYKEEFMTTLVKLMCFDGEFDEKEKQYILKIQKDYVWNETVINRTIKEFDRKVHGNKVKKFLCQIWNIIKGKGNFTKFNKKCFETSNMTLLEIKKIIKQEELTKKVYLRKEDDDLRNDIKYELTELYRRLQYVIDDANEEIKDLEEREITVALVGRTKAGKSSMFSLLCKGTGQQFIGKGAQRTTKISIATHLKGIKFIDTPGLNAANNKGRNDEQNTFNIIKKSDFVTFIFVTDSLSQDTKEHIESIVKNNIPVFIIINFKNAEIFEYKSKLNCFLENDFNWLEDNGVDRIAGWKENLERYADENNFSHVLDFGAIFIYAERVARQNLHIPLELTTREKVEISKKSNYDKVLGDMLQKIEKNALLYRWGKYFSNDMEVCEKIKKEYEATLEQICIKQQECQEKKEEYKKKINLYKENVHNGIMDGINELFRKEIPTDKIRKEAVKLSDNKYEKYINQLYGKVICQIQNICEEVILKEYMRLDEDVKQNMKENPIGKGCYCEENAENKIKINTHKESITSREILESFGIFLRGLGFVPGIGQTAQIASLTISEISGYLASSDDKPTKKQRMITLEKERIAELEKIFDELKAKFLRGVDSYINSSCDNWEHIYNNQLEYLQQNYQEVSEEKNQIRNIRNAVLQYYARIILKVRQRTAKFISAELLESEQGQTLRIEAKRCREEQITDMYMKINIIKA